MRLLRLFASAAALTVLSCPVAAQASPARPAFAGPPVSDAVLALSCGTWLPRGRALSRIADDASVSTMRQFAEITGIIKDVWVVEVANPLIVASVQASRLDR